MIDSWRPVAEPGGPGSGFSGGWVGYAGYDTARYAEPGKLPFDDAPPDDRSLPDLHMGLYRKVAVFDHVERLVYAVHHVLLDEHDSADAAFAAGRDELADFVERLMTHTKPLPAGAVEMANAPCLSVGWARYSRSVVSSNNTTTAPLRGVTPSA